MIPAMIKAMTITLNKRPFSHTCRFFSNSQINYRTSIKKGRQRKFKTNKEASKLTRMLKATNEMAAHTWSENPRPKQN